MAFENTVTVGVATASILKTVLDSSLARTLFRSIALRRIADKTSLTPVGIPNEDTETNLRALEQAGLIGSGRDGEKYYVTAKGLQVARDLQTLRFE